MKILMSCIKILFNIEDRISKINQNTLAIVDYLKHHKSIEKFGILALLTNQYMIILKLIKMDTAEFYHLY